MIVGVVNSLVLRFYTQNSKQSDFVWVIRLLFKWLIARGWDATWIKHLIIEATTKAQQVHSQTPTCPIENHQSINIFLHLQYRPEDITCTTLRAIYKKNCKQYGDIITTKGNKTSIISLTVAYSQGKNVCDVLTSAKLPSTPGHKVSKLFDVKNIWGCTNWIVSTIWHPQIFI